MDTKLIGLPVLLLLGLGAAAALSAAGGQSSANEGITCVSHGGRADDTTQGLTFYSEKFSVSSETEVLEAREAWQKVVSAVPNNYMTASYCKNIDLAEIYSNAKQWNPNNSVQQLPFRYVVNRGPSKSGALATNRLGVGSAAVKATAGYGHMPNRVAKSCLKSQPSEAGKIKMFNSCSYDVVVASCPLGTGPSTCHVGRDDWSVYGANIAPGQTHSFPASTGNRQTPVMTCRGPGSSVRVTITGMGKGQCLGRQ